MRRHAKAIVVISALLLTLALGATSASAVVPTVTTDPPSSVSSSSVHVTGTINPNGGGGASGSIPYYLEYKTPAAASWTYVLAGYIDEVEAESTSPIAVEGDLTGLLPGTQYLLRIVGTVEGVPTSSPEPYPSFETLPIAPQIGNMHSRAFRTEATLEGAINPGGRATTYHFEYGPTTGYGQSTAPVSVPAGTAAVPAAASLTSLAAASRYHFKLVAANAVGTTESADQSFRTLATADASCPNALVRAQQGTQGLANCRAYEQVSPADKNGYPVYWKPAIGPSALINFGLSAAARDGEAAVFSSWGVFAGSENSLIQTYRSRRSATGWVTTPGAPAINAYKPDGAAGDAIPTWYVATSDLSEGLLLNSNSWSARDTNKEDEEGPGVSREGQANDVYLRSATDETQLISANNAGDALGNIVKSSAVSIAGDGGHALFHSQFPPEGAGGVEGPYNVYERDGGVTRLVSEAPGGGPADPECGSILAGISTESDGKAQSSDGSKVVFQTAQYGNGNFLCEFKIIPTQLFVRIDGSRTVAVSESQRSEPDPAGTQNATFVGGSEDLSRIFFLSNEMLTDGAEALGAGPYLYEFKPDSEQLSAQAGDVKIASEGGVVAVSADGSSVYFRSGSDSSTLYRASDGQTTPVATSSTGNIGSISGIASEDGDTLLFTSARNLTGYDSQGRDEAYLYREGEPLRCISCGTSAAGAQSHAHISLGEAGRYADSLSTDGSIATFDTAKALLPADTNNRRDVYEYNAETEQLALVTDGKSLSDSYVYGMSRSARDVFFVTNASLVGQDRDGGDEDLYDARRDGGFPEGEGEAKLVECEGEACQAPASTQPAAGRSASAQLSGAGNEKARQRARCAKPRQGKKSARAKAQAKKARCAGTRKQQKKAKGSDRRATARQSHGKGR